MTHEDAGKYGAKHPAGTTADPALAAAVQDRAEDGQITCTAAHEIAGALGVAPAEVGKAVDLLELRIIACQLGLFGYYPGRKIVEAAEVVVDDLRDRLGPFAAAGEIGCAEAWDIADTLGIERMSVAAACETLGIKIKRCQLGAF